MAKRPTSFPMPQRTYARYVPGRGMVFSSSQDELDRIAPEEAPVAPTGKRDALGAGFEAAKTSLGTGLPYALDVMQGGTLPENERRYQQQLQASAAKQEQLLPGGPAGFGQGAGLGQIVGENLAYSAPQMVAQGVGGAVGTALGGPVGAGLGVGLVGAPMYVGSNVDRATQGGQTALTGGQAARSFAASIPQAAVDVLGARFLPGVGKYLGEEGFTGNMLSRAIKGTAAGIVTEGGGEALQQVGERYAAGLNLTDQEALGEYGQAAAIGGLLGGGFGAIGGVTNTTKLKEQRAAAEAAAAAAGKPADLLAIADTKLLPAPPKQLTYTPTTVPTGVDTIYANNIGMVSQNLQQVEDTRQRLLPAPEQQIDVNVVKANYAQPIIKDQLQAIENAPKTTTALATRLAKAFNSEDTKTLNSILAKQAARLDTDIYSPEDIAKAKPFVDAVHNLVGTYSSQLKDAYAKLDQQTAPPAPPVGANVVAPINDRAVAMATQANQQRAEQQTQAQAAEQAVIEQARAQQQAAAAQQQAAFAQTQQQTIDNHRLSVLKSVLSNPTTDNYHNAFQQVLGKNNLDTEIKPEELKALKKAQDAYSARPEITNTFKAAPTQTAPQFAEPERGPVENGVSSLEAQIPERGARRQAAPQPQAPARPAFELKSYSEEDLQRLEAARNKRAAKALREEPSTVVEPKQGELFTPAGNPTKAAAQKGVPSNRPKTAKSVVENLANDIAENPDASRKETIADIAHAIELVQRDVPPADRLEALQAIKDANGKALFDEAMQLYDNAQKAEAVAPEPIAPKTVDLNKVTAISTAFHRPTREWIVDAMNAQGDLIGEESGFKSKAEAFAEKARREKALKDGDQEGALKPFVEKKVEANATQKGEQPQSSKRQRKGANEVGTTTEASSSNSAEPVAETAEEIAARAVAEIKANQEAKENFWRVAELKLTGPEGQELNAVVLDKTKSLDDVKAKLAEIEGRGTKGATQKSAEPAIARRTSIESEKVALRKDITTTARNKKNLPADQAGTFLTLVNDANSVADLKSIKADLDAQVKKNIAAPTPTPPPPRVISKSIKTMSEIIQEKRAAEKERMAGVADTLTKRPDLPKDQVEPEAEPEVTDENIVEDEEVDYDTHPLMVEHDEKYDDAQNRLSDTENTTEVRKLAKKFIKEGLIDEDNYDEIDTRIRDADQEDKFDEAKSAVEDALTEQQDNQRSDVESLIDEEIADKAAAKTAQFLRKTKVQPLADNAKQVAERAAVEAKFRAELDRLGVRNAGLRILTQLEGRAEYGRDVGGEYSPAKKLITVVMQPNTKGEYSLGHEAIHAMEHFGLITPQEKAAILGWAKGQKEIRDFVQSQYGEESKAVQDSEYVAEAYALWLKREVEFPGRINLFFRKLKGFIDAFKNYLLGRGFISADALLEAVDSGFFTQRQQGKATLGQTTKSFFRESTAPKEYAKANDRVREYVGGYGNSIAAAMVIANKLTDMAVRAGVPAARTMERLLADQGRITARLDRKIEDLSERFDGLKNAVEKGVGEGSANSVIQKIRFAKKWGFDPMYKDADGKKIAVDVDPELSKLFNKLSPEAQQVVRDVFQLSRDNLYAKKEAVMRTIGSEYDALIKAARDDLSSATGERAIKLGRELKNLEAKKSRQLTRYQSLLKIDPNTPYAPIKRFGDFVVVGRSKEYVAAEQKAAREKTPEAYAELRKMQEDGEHYYVAYADDRWKAILLRDKIAQVYDAPDMFRKDEASEAQIGGSEIYAAFQRMQKMIQEQGDSMDPKMRKSLTALATDLYLGTLAESSSRKAEMAARLVHGGDFDMVRGAIAQGRSDARFIGSVEKNGEIADAITQMKKEAKAGGTSTDQARELVNQITARHAANLAPAPQNKTIDKILSFTTAMYLTTSPMFFVQQAVQPFMVSVPVAAGKHGYGRTMDALNKGYDVVRQAWGDADITKPLDLDKLKGTMWAVAQVIADSNALDVAIDKDMGNWTSEANGPINSAMTTVSKKLGGWTRKLEAINRLSTGVMMFELEMGKKTGENVDPEAYKSYVEDFKKTHPEGATDEHPMLSEQQYVATQEAIRLIMDTHGDYSLKASPLFMRSGAGRVLSQFKKFQIMQLSLYTQAINDGFFAKDIPAAEKEIARRTLLYMTGHAALFAGALGLPGAAAGEWLWEFINKLMGRQGPFTAEGDLRKAIGNPTIANLLINGAPTLAGVDLSGSLGQGNLLSIAPYADIPKDEATYKDAIIRMAGPAIGGVGLDFAKGIGFMNDGQYYKGLEKMMPKGFSNAIKAYRESTEGVTDKGGEVTVGSKNIGIGATIATALGLRTTEVSNRQYRQGAAIETKQYFQDQTSTMKREYIQAYDKKDGAKMQELRVKWLDMQKSRDENGLSRQPLSDLIREPMRLAKREKNVLGGVKVSKSNRAMAAQLAEETGYVPPEEE